MACDISNDADRIAGATLASGESVLILLSSSNESSDVAAREFASILARPKYGFGEIRKGTKAASSRQEQCRDEGYGASCLDNTNGIRVWRHGGWQDERDAQETTSRNVVAIEGPTVEFAYFKRFIVSVRYDNELVSQANFFQLDTPQPKWCPDLSRLMEQIVDESTVIESETTTAH